MGGLQRYRPVALIWLYVAAIAVACWISSNQDSASSATVAINSAPAVLLFVLVHRPSSKWPVIIVTTFGIELAIRQFLEPDIAGALFKASGTSLHALMASLLYARMRGKLVQPYTINEVVYFSSAVLLGSILSTTMLYLGSWGFGTPFVILDWWLDWLSNALGVSITLPFMLAWRSLPRISLDSIRLTESLALALLWGLFTFLVESESAKGHAEVLFLLVPAFVWTASRFGLRWATLGNLLFVLAAPKSEIVNPSSLEWALSQGTFLLMLVLSSLWLAVLLHDREKAIKSHEASDARLWAVLSSIPDIVLRVDKHGRCIERLGAAAPLNSSQDLDEAISLGSLLHPGPAHKVRETVQKVLGDNVPRECCVSQSTKNQEKWLEARITPVKFGRAEREPSAIVSIRDITDSRLSQRRAVSTEKARALQSLTGGVAHDFNNLLTTIIGNLDLLRADLNTDDQQASLNDAAQAANRGRELTQSLLAYSESQPLQPKTLDLSRYLLALAPQLNLSKSSRVELDADLEKDGPWTVCVDPARLEDALRGLVDNARDAAGSRGQVTVRADRRQMRDSPTEPARKFVRLLIEDNGEGMSSQTLNRACDPFFTTRGVGRSGLGLSVVRGFARQSGGHLRLRSTTGEGTQASLFLPLVELPIREDSRQGLPNPQRVVIAADRDPTVRRLVGRHAARLGYVALEANSTGETETLLHRLGTVALVVAELHLPGGQGGQALLADKPHQPAILLTEQTPETSHCMPHVLTKPFEPGALGTIMGELLPHSSWVVPMTELEESWPESDIRASNIN